MTRTQRILIAPSGRWHCADFEMCQLKDEENARRCVCDCYVRRHVKAVKHGKRCNVQNCRWCRVEAKMEEKRHTTLKAKCGTYWERRHGELEWKRRTHKVSETNKGTENRCQNCLKRRKKKRHDVRKEAYVKKLDGTRQQCELLYCHNHETHQQCAECSIGVVCTRCGFACCHHGAHDTDPACEGVMCCERVSDGDERPWYWPAPHPREKKARGDSGCDCDECTSGKVVDHPFDCGCCCCAWFCA